MDVKNQNKSNPFRSAILWGIVSLALYLLVFINQETVTDYYTRGGYFAIAVIATALIFSLVHGTFSSFLVEVMGWKPANKK